MLTQVVNGVEKIQDYLKDIKVDVLGMNQKVESHTTTIKKLDQHLC